MKKEEFIQKNEEEIEKNKKQLIEKSDQSVGKIIKKKISENAQNYLNFQKILKANKRHFQKN